MCRARVLLCNGQPALLGVNGPRGARPKGNGRAVKLVTAFRGGRGHVRTVWISRLGRELELVVFTSLSSFGVHGYCVVVCCACVVIPPFLDVRTDTRSDQTGWESWR